MALSLPEANASWQFALLSDTQLTPVEENGKLCVLAAATDAPAWRSKSGFVMPPPQGTIGGAQYQLTLMRFAKTTGRIAQFPLATHRA